MYSLHGGERGFSRFLWEAESLNDVQDRWSGLALRRVSPNGEDGFPGTLTVEVTYYLTADNHLIMYYRAESDAPTPVSLTNHAYWNLEGEAKGDIHSHQIMIDADKYVEVDANSIPTGQIVNVSGAMDLRSDVLLKELGFPGSTLSKGYDHCYVLNKTGPRLQPGSWGEDLSGIIDRLEPRFAAAASVARSGRTMELYSTYPGVQFYTSAHLNEKRGRNGLHFRPYSAFCLETQFFPDSPNHPNFPNTILRPGQLYEQITVHHFSRK